MAGRRWRVPLEVRHRVLSMRAEGFGYEEIQSVLAVSAGTVRNVLVDADLPGKIECRERGGRLSLNDRIEIRVGVERGESFAAIARRLGWHRSTISREVARNTVGGRDRYRPGAAQQRAEREAQRPHPSKLQSNPLLLTVVVERLEQWWSPEQIAGWLRATFPDNPEMWVSHETIYKSLYVQGRGELRRELARCLRSGRAQRRARSPLARGGKIPGMVSISQRPAEAADRAVPGFWEGDLIMGPRNQTAVGTLVERTTRYVQLLHLAEGKTAAQVRQAMAAKIAELPAELVRSITWDQGSEMAEHRRFSIDTGIEVYFCDPHSPWQRGSNENTNGLLRQYMPKGVPLDKFSHAELESIADSLNNRPRKTLGWKTPKQALTALIDALDP